MSSEVKANKLSPATGTALQISDSGDTTTIPSGATLDVSSATMTGFTIPSGQTLTVASGGTITNSGTATGFGSDNTPAFQAYISAHTALPHDAGTTVPFNTEDFDTDSAYDNSSTYRFTVPAGEGGKYFLYSHLVIEGSANTTLNYAYSYIRVNGTAVLGGFNDFQANPVHYASYTNVGVITLSAADYVDCNAYLATSTGSAGQMWGANARAGLFGAYKMIGL
mgnify:CR=1 FL=1|tara:strand:+ start:753 stop:1421 length:669 start_codon:yes stop_codon:yes gene_type:complete